MSLERILTDYGEPLQYVVYFGLLAALGADGGPRAPSRWPGGPRRGGGRRTSG